MDLSALLHAAQCISEKQNRLESNIEIHSNGVHDKESEAVFALSSLICANRQAPTSPEQSYIATSPSLSLCSSNPSDSPVIHLRTSPVAPARFMPSPPQTYAWNSTQMMSELPAECVKEPPKPFECTWAGCRKAFPRKADLTRHERIHQNIRPFVCHHDGCGKAFSQRSALKVHIRIHTGEKPHTCEHAGCQKSFSDSSSLARHRKLHTTDGMSYVCDQPGCSMKFGKKIYLLRHRKAAHGSPKSVYPSSPSETVGSPSASPILLPQSAFKHQEIGQAHIALPLAFVPK